MMRIYLTIQFLGMCLLSSCNSGDTSGTKTNDFRQFVREGNLAEVKRAVKKGYDVNTLNRHGGNALHESIVDYGVMEYLISEGIDVNNQFLKAQDGKTALHLACIASNASVEVVKLLLDNGANPTIKDANGKTALYYAELEGNKDKIDVLEQSIGLRPPQQNKNQPKK